MARSGSDGVRAGEFTSNPPQQHKNDNDDQDDADDTDTAMSVAVTVAAEAAAEAAKQENDEDDDEDEPERHGLGLQCVGFIEAKIHAGVCAILLISSRLAPAVCPPGNETCVRMAETYRQRLSRSGGQVGVGLSVA